LGKKDFRTGLTSGKDKDILKLSENGGESKLTFERTPVILGEGRDQGYAFFLPTYTVFTFFTGKPD